MADYGTDIATIAPDGSIDLDPYFRVVSGSTVVSHAIVKRLVTPPGGLLDDEDYGYDLRALVHGSTSKPELDSAVAEIEAQCLADERVSDATITLSASGGVLTCRVQVVLVDGQTLRLVLAVSAVSVEVLEG